MRLQRIILSRSAGSNISCTKRVLLSTTASLRPEYGLFIDGKEVPSTSGSISSIRNPATGETLCSVHEGGQEDMTKAIEVASEAFQDGRWSGMQPRDRGRILNRAAAILRERIPRMAALESLQTGRCLREYNAQLARIPDWFEYHAALCQTIEGNLPPFSDDDHLAYVRRVPLGVCGLITSWNHPLLISNKKISVALAAGNTVVVKPPPPAPCSIIEMAQILQEAGVPDGVINVVPCENTAAGRAMTTHPDMMKLDLTGGTPTGRLIGEGAGKAVKHFTAELGGNAPILVFADCPNGNDGTVHAIDRAVNGVCFAAFVASGQTCVSAKRILIESSIFHEFVNKLAVKVDALRLKNPLDLDSHIGPLVHAQALATVESQVDAALAEGAKVVAGGKRPTIERLGGNECLLNGHFYEPTILAIPSSGNSAFQEEIFGPVITVMPFENEAEAIKLANDSKYGLGAGIWTSDVARAHRVARQVRAGVLWVNAHHRNDPSTPWGGFKESGVGRENGWEAFREYTETQSIVVRTSDEAEDWFGNPEARYS